MYKTIVKALNILCALQIFMNMINDCVSQHNKCVNLHTSYIDDTNTICLMCKMVCKLRKYTPNV